MVRWKVWIKPAVLRHNDSGRDGKRVNAQEECYLIIDHTYSRVSIQATLWLPIAPLAWKSAMGSTRKTVPTGMVAREAWLLEREDRAHRHGS
jgi:hypothetical protein